MDQDKVARLYANLRKESMVGLVHIYTALYCFMGGNFHVTDSLHSQVLPKSLSKARKISHISQILLVDSTYIDIALYVYPPI